MAVGAVAATGVHGPMPGPGGMMAGIAGDRAVALEMSGVRKRFSRSGRWVLDGIDMTAAQGTLTVVAGGNGSGKSTLLRIAVGATLPTSGRISPPPGPAAYVPERLPARLRMTAGQYLAHMGRMRGLAPAVAAERARDILDRLALQPGPDVPIGILSRGNGQKVALAQALLAPARLMVLDEPYGGLDEGAVAQAAALVDEARAGGAVVLLAAPDPDVPNVADATYRLSGRRLASCRQAVVLERPAWAVLAGAACCLAEFLIPGAPPARQLAGAFLVSAPGQPGLARPLELAAAQTVLISAVLGIAGYAVAHGRT